jgi:bifunctional non-homologous end joining protein LigD
MSEGISGPGKAYFDAAVARGLEGVVAKQLDSAYQPGKRTDCWLKIKRHETMAAVVIGFVPAEDRPRDFSALIVAVDDDGALRSVGKVGSGFSDAVRERINRFLWSHVCPKPIVQCSVKGTWVEPMLYCTIRCMERTPDGQLRAPVFGGLHGVISD